MALRDILVHFGVQVDQSQLVEASHNVGRLVVEFNRLQRIAGFAMAALGARALTETADEYINLQNRLRAITSTSEEFQVAQKGVVDIARATSSPVQDIAEAYQRYTMATEGLGVSQEQVLEFTKRLTQATVLGGATAQESRAALIQFAQGMGTNFKAAGQEIRSIQEQAPLLAKIIAKAAGGTAAELKDLAKQGKITSKMVFAAILDAGGDLDEQMKRRQKSFANIWTRFGTEGMQFIKQLLPVFSRLINLLESAAEWTQRWVEDGSAMNSFLAGAVVVVTALTVAFGGLAMQLAATAAPFIGLFLVLEDFFTFLNGGDSMLGRTLGKDADKIRDQLNGIKEAAEEWIKNLVAGNETAAKAFAQLFADRFKEAMKAAVDEWLQYAGQKLTEGLVSKWTEIKQAFTGDPNDPNADKTRIGGSDDRNALVGLLGGVNEGTANLFKKIREGENGVVATEPTPWAPIGEVPTLRPQPVFQSPYRDQNVTPPSAPQITNNVTVQGNATPATAREIARETGTATAGALGRDRSAIGAAVGVQ